MNKLTIAFMAVATIGVASIDSTSHADNIRTAGRFGLGLGSGTLTNGLSAKYFMAQNHALQFHLGAYGHGKFKDRWGHVEGFGFGMNYLFEMPTIVRAGRAFDLAWNIGVGAGVGFRDGRDHKDHHDDGTAIAIAGVLGLEFNFIPIPIDIVLEWRPSILLIHHFGGNLIDFTAQIRYYF